MTHRERRSYDYRIKAQVIATGNPNLFPELEIPRSAASSWLHRGLGDVVVLDNDGQTDELLRERVARLERGVSILTAVLRLVLVLLRLSPSVRKVAASPRVILGEKPTQGAVGDRNGKFVFGKC
jgi:hypothetical protein